MNTDLFSGISYDYLETANYDREVPSLAPIGAKIDLSQYLRVI